MTQVSILVPWLLILAGTALLVAAALTSSRNRRIMWTEVCGTITHSEVGFDGEQYHPWIQYAYSFGSQTHIGNTVRPASLNYNWPGPARRVCRRYPVGAEVVVYVDPSRPGTAVLEPRINPAGMLLIFGISALLIVSGLALLGA